MDSILDEYSDWWWYQKTCLIIGSIFGLLAFFSTWVELLDNYNTLLALLLGWIPSALVCVIASLIIFLLLRYVHVISAICFISYFAFIREPKSEYQTKLNTSEINHITDAELIDLAKDYNNLSDDEYLDLAREFETNLREIEAPDGSIRKFPIDMSDDKILEYMQKEFPKK